MPKEIFNFTIRAKDGAVDLFFDEAILKLSFTSQQARALAKTLVIKADKLDMDAKKDVKVGEPV